MKLMLVYQAGIANVFQVQGFMVDKSATERDRVLQGDFRTCEQFCLGAQYAGAEIAVAACNRAGDIGSDDWTWDVEAQPFSDKFRPPHRLAMPCNLERGCR